MHDNKSNLPRMPEKLDVTALEPESSTDSPEPVASGSPPAQRLLASASGSAAHTDNNNEEEELDFHFARTPPAAGITRHPLFSLQSPGAGAAAMMLAKTVINRACSDRDTDHICLIVWALLAGHVVITLTKETWAYLPLKSDELLEFVKLLRDEGLDEMTDGKSASKKGDLGDEQRAEMVEKLKAMGNEAEVESYLQRFHQRNTAAGIVTARYLRLVFEFQMNLFETIAADGIDMKHRDVGLLHKVITKAVPQSVSRADALMMFHVSERMNLSVGEICRIHGLSAWKWNGLLATVTTLLETGRHEIRVHNDSNTVMRVKPSNLFVASLTKSVRKVTQCGMCGREDVKLKVCSKCHTVGYCTAACQVRTLRNTRHNHKSCFSCRLSSCMFCRSLGGRSTKKNAGRHA